MAKVIKRDGKVVDYNNAKILTAIKNAMYETAAGVDEALCVALGAQVDEVIKASEENLTVEAIQDIVEIELMKSERKDVAKRYIIYRNERDRTRDVRHKDDRLLSDTFISKYKHLPSPMKQLGDFVYYRTYSRWLEEEKRRDINNILKILCLFSFTVLIIFSRASTEPLCHKILLHCCILEKWHKSDF